MTLHLLSTTLEWPLMERNCHLLFKVVHENCFEIFWQSNSVEPKSRSVQTIIFHVYIILLYSCCLCLTSLSDFPYLCLYLFFSSFSLFVFFVTLSIVFLLIFNSFSLFSTFFCYPFLTFHCCVKTHK